MGGWMAIYGCTGKSCVATGSQHADFASAVSQGPEAQAFSVMMDTKLQWSLGFLPLFVFVWGQKNSSIEGPSSMMGVPACPLEKFLGNHWS
jgi:hypothetical protein